MNYGEIRKQLIANMGGESATDVHSEEDRTRAIHQAYMDITLDEEIGQAQVQVAIAPGANFLALPPSIMVSPDGIELRSIKLIQINISDMKALQEEAVNPGVPIYFAVDTERPDGLVHLYPASNGIYTLNINILSQPTPMSLDTDQPWGGRYLTFHNLIPMRAAHFLYREKGGSQEAMQASRFWLSEYDRERKRLSRLIDREEGGVTVLHFRTKPTRGRRRGWMDE